MKLNFIKRYLLFVALAWTTVCGVVLIAHLQADYERRIQQSLVRAQAMLDRDLLYRDWAASHGGVYVPVTAQTPPNPHLAFLPERDIETVDGRRLTLVNPSYMTSQAFALDNRLGEAKSKITSLKFLSEANAPDPWETAALQRLEAGEALVSELVETGRGTAVRMIRPFFVEAACLKCHAGQGYEVGDVRGGLSLTLPYSGGFRSLTQHNLDSLILFLLLWGTGLALVVLLGRKLFTQTVKAVESDHQRDQAEMSLNFLSNYDRRTNLPNRFKFEELLFDLFRARTGQDGAIAVMVLEVRNYKQIVDNFDHPVGDALSKLLAERMANLLTENDSVARFGEERLLFSYSCDADREFSEAMMQEMLAEAAKPLLLEDHEFHPVVCMGAALYPQDATDAKRLVQRAVSALMFCQEREPSGTVLFSQSLQEDARWRLEIESGLRQALAEGSLDLYLQPQVDSSAALIGAEALLRWRRDEGFVSPADFVPVAEESGLILSIGEWVLQTAALHAIRLAERLGRIVPVGVNVSARQFQDGAFVDIIDEVLAIDGMIPEMLEIEITEGTFIEDIERTIEILTDLKVRGLKIAIDDFGTGYSSLSYLNRFPVDRLKIDRSFVIDIAHNEDDRLLVSLITEMGRKLGLDVIAEGVEDDIQKNLLIGMGCHALQGYLFGKPLAFEAFCAHIEEGGGGMVVSP